MAKITLSFVLMALFTLIYFTENVGAQSAPKTPSFQNMGKMLYEGFCSECHGKDLNGSDKGPPFLNRIYLPGHHGDASFYNAAKNGAKAHHWKFGDMKPVEGIEDTHVALIVKYVRYVQKQSGMF